MLLTRRSRRLLLALLLYATFCSIIGIFVADGALHPARRPVTLQEEAQVRQNFSGLHANLQDVSITTPDHAILRAWLVHPGHPNGSSVILFHGLGDNRLGMTGYAQLLLVHGFTVLLPDGRAHGASGGDVATYGLLERYDIHQWFDLLAAADHPRCIFGLGESMGASQLLQSLDTDTPFCAIVAESPFSNFREIAYDRMGQPFHLGPWFGRMVLRPLVEAAFLRARWKYGFDMSKVAPENSATHARIPILLIHGQIDSNIPIRHSRRIQARNPNTILWEVADADHCGALSSSPREFEQKLLAWFAAPPSLQREGAIGN
jgi:pimeloyl-ACP methyl ester carboxylesterase